MSHSWRELRRLFLDGTENAPQAAAQVLDHLTFAHRDLCAQIDVPELFQPHATQATTANQDYIDIDCDVYYIQSIVDLSTGRRLDEEPEGNMGRSRFLDTTGKPAAGALQFWMRQGKRIYLRQTPDSVVTLRLQYKIHPPEVTEGDLDKYPLTPQHFDEAILWLAMAKFYTLHPPKLVDGTPDYGRARSLQEQAAMRIAMPEDVKAKEGKSRNAFVTQQGYQFNLGVGLR